MKKHNRVSRSSNEKVRQFIKKCSLMLYLVDKSRIKSPNRDLVLETVRGVCNQAVHMMELDVLIKGTFHQWCADACKWWMAVESCDTDPKLYQDYDSMVSTITYLARTLGYEMYKCVTANPDHYIFIATGSNAVVING